MSYRSIAYVRGDTLHLWQTSTRGNGVKVKTKN